MRTAITVHLNPTDRKRLQVIVDDRNSPQKHVWRARIVLATADGLGTAAIMRTAGVSKTAAWRWQARFLEEGVPGLLHDKMRPARAPKLADEVAERIVALAAWRSTTPLKTPRINASSSIITSSKSPSSGPPILTKPSPPLRAATKC